MSRRRSGRLVGLAYPSAGPFLVLAGMAAACSSGGPSARRPDPFPVPPPAEAVEAEGTGNPAIRITRTIMADSIPADGAMETLVAPFRERMGEEISQVIGEAAVDLTEAVPEGTLGNFAADAMLWAARQRLDRPVHMALTNNGGLRIPIPAGPITVSQMFELMPFDNMLSVLTLSGGQVQEMADELAAMRGEPVAGFSFRIEAEGEGFVARDLLVAGEPVDPGRLYLLVTNDYMASGGEAPSPIHEPLARQDLPVLLRDAFIEYVRERGVIDARLEGRISGGIVR